MARAVPARAETIQAEGGLAISGEFTPLEAVLLTGFTGASVETETPPTADSDERVFATLPLPPADSGEGTFTTSSAPTGDQSPTTSPETTFQTLPISVHCQGGALTCETGSSEEGAFTTLPIDESPPAPPGGGGGGGGGGGRSGGGYGYRLPTAPVPNPVVGECPIYLTKFIRLGANNDPIEVLKLQRFLRDFERLEVPVDGIYGEATFEAVKIFQLRYADAILKPWGIDYPTGYVYITTTLAINNLYCERDPATTLDLRSLVPAPSQSDKFEVVPAPTPTPTLPLMGEATPPTGGTGRLMLAALGVFDFFKQIPRWWWIVFLSLVILYFVFNKRGDKRDESP